MQDGPGDGGGGDPRGRERGAQPDEALGVAGVAGTAPDRVTFEDVAVGFSSEEWSLLEGSQKDLHQEVMLELCSLLLSLGHSVPPLDFSSLTCQPDGTPESHRPSWRRPSPWVACSDQTRREEPPFPEGMEGPCNLEEEKAEKRLAPASDEESKDQSSHHLCALMKLVNEIPEFLCGHAQAGRDRAGGSESRGGHVGTIVQLKRYPHFRRHEPLADVVSLSVSSPAGTPSISSPKGEWSEPTTQGTSFSPCDAQGWMGTGLPAFLPVDADGATDAEPTTEKNLAEGQPKSEEGLQFPRLSTERKDSPPMDPRPDTDDSSADSGCLDQPRSWGCGGAERPTSPGPSRSHAEADGRSEGRKTMPKTAAKTELPKSPRKAPPKLGPEAASDEKPPLQGLLKCLKDLVTLQSSRGPKTPPKASMERQPRTPGVGRWGGRSDPSSIQVKTEASREEPGAHNVREGPGFSGATRRNPSISHPEEGRRVNSPGGKEEGNFSAVKTEQEASSSPRQGLQRELALVMVGARGSPEKAQDRSSISAVRVKSEEEHPLRGHEDILEEKNYHHHLRSNFSPGSKLGLWVPYSAEWGPATSPLHGLLNCLKDIPVPRLLPPQILPAKRGVTGEKERQRGGRRGRFGPPSDTCLPQGSEAGLGEMPAQQSFLPLGYTAGSHGREPAGRKMEAATGQEELGRAQSPLPSLGKGFKETPSGSPSQASSPAMSSSPDGLPRWTSGPTQRARREEGFSHCSTPLQGLEKCLKDIQTQRWSPAVTSSIHSSPDRLRQWTPEPAPWARREGGGSPPRVPPLQGLENCLKEIAPSRDFLANTSPAGRNLGAPKQPGTEEAHSPRPWLAGSLPPPCASDATSEHSPLHQLMNCLKEIPIQRPSYLNPPSAASFSSSSSSSNCSETERDQQSPGSSIWWDRSQGRPQLPGSERETLVGWKVTTEPKRKRSSTQLPAKAEERLSSPREAPISDRGEEAPSTSLLGRRRNDAKDPGDVKQISPSVHPLRSSRAQQNGMFRASEAREDKPTPALLVNKSFHHERKKSQRDTAPIQTPTCSNPRSHNSRDGMPEGDTGWSPGEEQVQPQPGDTEGATGSSPLQGLLRCLKEITYPSTPSPCPSSAGKRPRAPRYTQEEEEEEDEEDEEAAHCKKKSWQGAVPSSFPLSDVETWGAQPNGHSCSPNPRTSDHKPSDSPRWSPPVSFRMGTRRASATGRDMGSPSAKKRHPEPVQSCHCAHGAEPGIAQPLLSKQLGRLAADVSSLCQDLSGLQSHVWRLEQEAQGWALELAGMRLENRRLAKYTRRLESRCRLLETRSRRLNLRLLGLPEGVEGGDLAAFLRRALPEVLGWPPAGPALEIESAWRVRGQESTAKPRPVLFRLLRLADKAAVLEAARAQPLRFGEAQLAILPDLGTPRRRPPLGPFQRSRWVVDLLLGGQSPSPWGLSSALSWREPPAPCTPLAVKAPPGMLGSHEQHNP